MKEILSIKQDEELDMTDVHIRVPGFQNFGQRLGDLERQFSETIKVRPEPDSDPELEAEIEADVAETMEMLKGTMASMKGDLESMPEGPQKEALKLMMQEFEKGDQEEEEVENDPEHGDGARNEDRFTYDLEKLRVGMQDEVTWDKVAEARLDDFLAKWPLIRPAVLQATFDHYKEIYPQIFEIFGDDDDYQFLMPKPTTPEAVADLFIITAIYLRDDGCVGLGGHCTWDDEHGYGVLLKDNQVVTVGHESDAFA
ncbi:MAG: hypothetical protein H0X66_22465 [Verrucomicrobia bacterium]|nr:hypothetical protein [Verrucomicrobiota bacterium]